MVLPLVSYFHPGIAALYSKPPAGHFPLQRLPPDTVYSTVSIQRALPSFVLTKLIKALTALVLLNVEKS